MPEVQEVFRVATQKVRPDRGFVDRQHDHRRRQERRRKIGAFAVSAAIALVIAMLFVRSGSDERQGQPGASAPASAQPSSVDPGDRPPIRRHVETAEGVPFSFRVNTFGWERFGSISINKSELGPQGAEAMISWSTFPDGDYADPFGHDARPCTSLLGSAVGPSAADLAAAVSRAPGTKLVAGPSGLTVGGYPATSVVLAVRKDVGCDPGFFYSWRDVNGGALWPTTPVGATMRVWIVDVGGTRLFIDAATSHEASVDLDQEIQQIVGSIRFGRSSA
jgi:hypothetical protein